MHRPRPMTISWLASQSLRLIPTISEGINSRLYFYSYRRSRVIRQWLVIHDEWNPFTWTFHYYLPHLSALRPDTRTHMVTTSISKNRCGNNASWKRRQQLQPPKQLDWSPLLSASWGTIGLILHDPSACNRQLSSVRLPPTEVARQLCSLTWTPSGISQNP